MQRGHWEFSHFEWVEIPRWDFWGRYRPRYVQRAVEVYVREIHITVTIDLEASRLEQETRRLWALKKKVDAEVALIDSCIELSRKTAELEHLQAIPADEAPKQIAYMPNVPAQPVRSGGR
jgi:hypothetical protein